MGYLDFTQIFNGLLLILGLLLLYYSKNVKEKHEVPNMIMTPEAMQLCKDVPGYCNKLAKYMVIFGIVFALCGAGLLIAAFVLKIGARAVSVISTIVLVVTFAFFLKFMSDLTREFF